MARYLLTHSLTCHSINTAVYYRSNSGPPAQQGTKRGIESLMTVVATRLGIRYAYIYRLLASVTRAITHIMYNNGYSHKGFSIWIKIKTSYHKLCDRWEWGLSLDRADIWDRRFLIYHRRYKHMIYRIRGYQVTTHYVHIDCVRYTICITFSRISSSIRCESRWGGSKRIYIGWIWYSQVYRYFCVFLFCKGTLL